MTCEWCGHVHDVTALCTKRPTWGRRGFLQLVGMAAIGLAVRDMPTAPLSKFIGVVVPVNHEWAWSIKGLNKAGRDWTTAEFHALCQFVRTLEIPETQDAETAEWEHPTGARMRVEKFRV